MTGNQLGRFSRSFDPFQASYWLNKESLFAHQSPLPSPASTQEFCISQVRQARSRSSLKPAATEGKGKAAAAETQPAATREGASDKRQTGDQ